ncbi:hypothetical protein K3495_g8682 [Podosphaera aphanis]|nr:hypothetical protein K3495_g8682 [Podosphaera aphanis]
MSRDENQDIASNTELYPLSSVLSGLLAEKPLREAPKDLSYLIHSVEAQEAKYGKRLDVHCDFYCRHLIIQQFLQKQLANRSQGTRRQLSLSIAKNYGKRDAFARSIVKAEKSWVGSRVIPVRNPGSGKASWMNDEDLKESIRYFASLEKDCRHSHVSKSTSNSEANFDKQD